MYLHVFPLLASTPSSKSDTGTVSYNQNPASSAAARAAAFLSFWLIFFWTTYGSLRCLHIIHIRNFEGLQGAVLATAFLARLVAPDVEQDLMLLSLERHVAPVARLECG